MKIFSLIMGLGLFMFATAQDPAGKLAIAFGQLESDRQFKHAQLSLYVEEAGTGRIIFNRQAAIGLAPASCQKLITSVTAFELLGRGFHYKTYIGTDPTADQRFNAGSLFILGTGDPSLGSWRWKATTDTTVITAIAKSLRSHGIMRFERNLYVDDLFYGLQTVPDGWVWQDMGNYYGASCMGFNWHENQYDLLLQPGEREGLNAEFVKTFPELPGVEMHNGIRTGAPNSGDNGYIYTSPLSPFAITTGTIPLQKGLFTISGSMPDPAAVFAAELTRRLRQDHFTINDTAYTYRKNLLNKLPVPRAMQIIDSLLSPALDSINYWFLKRSVNLFGEALLKSIAVNRYPMLNRDLLYDSAISLVKGFWEKHNIEKAELNILDGSGLSPANRVTTRALVTVLQYARKQEWFPSFFNALPVMNGLNMKDGYIAGVRSFTGFVKSHSGKEYVFSFIVNNFDGSAIAVRDKMWKLIDILK